MPVCAQIHRCKYDTSRHRSQGGNGALGLRYIQTPGGKSAVAIGLFLRQEKD